MQLNKPAYFNFYPGYRTTFPSYVTHLQIQVLDHLPHVTVLLGFKGVKFPWRWRAHTPHTSHTWSLQWTKTPCVRKVWKGKRILKIAFSYHEKVKGFWRIPSLIKNWWWWIALPLNPPSRTFSSSPSINLGILSASSAMHHMVWAYGE